MIVRKLLIIFMLSSLVIILTGCGKKMTTSTTTTSHVTTTTETNETKESVLVSYVENQVDLVLRDFFTSNYVDHPFAYSDKVGQARNDATLWDYSATFIMAMKYYKVTDQSQTKTNWERLVHGLEWYRNKTRTDHLLYASKNGTERPAFYDDNVWLVIGMIEAYLITEDDTWLNKAVAVQDYIYTGWFEQDPDPETNGGLLWREYEKDETGKYIFHGNDAIARNTCINGPAIIASALLYKITGEEKYLTWAERIYAWVDKVLKNKFDLYNDNISIFPDGRKVVELPTFTYNQGTMISAGALLYEITGNDVYLENAKKTAESVETRKGVVYQDVPNAVFYISDEPWFRVYLVQGFLDLARVNPESSGYIERVINAVKYGWENSRDSRGYLTHGWGKGKNNGEMVELRHIVGNTEILALLSEYELFVKP